MITVCNGVFIVGFVMLYHSCSKCGRTFQPYLYTVKVLTCALICALFDCFN